MVCINKDILKVGEEAYYGTPGLFQLLFLKNPNLNEVTRSDFDNYKKIVVQTNAHTKNHSPTGPILQLKSNIKYKNIISKLFPVKTGDGFTDPNILVNRLRHLLDSSGGREEILLIEAQLRRGGIIA